MHFPHYRVFFSFSSVPGTGGERSRKNAVIFPSTFFINLYRGGGHIDLLVPSLKSGDEVAAAAGFQVVEAVDLTGDFQFTPVDRVVPAFNVDGA